MKIYFKISNLEDKDWIKKVKNAPSFREELSLEAKTFPYADFGELHIEFYNYSFVIDTEMIWTLVFRVHTNAIERILNKEEIDKFQYTFEIVESDYINFSLEGDFGLRIRHCGDNAYWNDKGDLLYVSYNYVKQEIIVNKQEYIEKMLDCATRFISYRELLNETDPHFFHWKNKVIELKKRVDSLK